MKTFDISIGWASSVDTIFVDIVKRACRKKKLSVRKVTYANLSDTIRQIRQERLLFRAFIDRASFDHPSFMHLAVLLSLRGAHVLNNPDAVAQSANKSVLHRLFTKHKLPVRKTYILLPKTAKKTISKYSARAWRAVCAHAIRWRI